jgi:tRNA dimethylallyltransferase
VKLIFVVGPTATGKTEMAVSLAERFQIQVANSDSIQVYKDLNIGSAKPSAEDLRRAPHALLSFVEAPATFTAGDFRREALAVIESEKKLNKEKLIFVGGSGFYLKALEFGMYSAPPASAEVSHLIESEIQNGKLAELYAELKAADPKAALKIAPQDQYRISRAVGILRTYDLKPSDVAEDFEKKKLETKLPYPILKIGMDMSREDLRRQIEKRTDSMFEAGLIDEVKSLLDRNLENWSPLESVGYKEVTSYLHGDISAGQMRELIVQNTMRLAKKQKTWFKADSEVQWFSLAEKDKVFRLAEEFLKA